MYFSAHERLKELSPQCPKLIDLHSRTSSLPWNIPAGTLLSKSSLDSQSAGCRKSIGYLPAKDPAEKGSQTSFHSFLSSPMGGSFKSLERLGGVCLFDATGYGKAVAYQCVSPLLALEIEQARTTTDF
jgi:hypothetical protein